MSFCGVCEAGTTDWRVTTQYPAFALMRAQAGFPLRYLFYPVWDGVQRREHASRPLPHLHSLEHQPEKHIAHLVARLQVVRSPTVKKLSGLRRQIFLPSEYTDLGGVPVEHPPFSRIGTDTFLLLLVLTHRVWSDHLPSRSNRLHEVRAAFRLADLIVQLVTCDRRFALVLFASPDLPHAS